MTGSCSTLPANARAAVFAVALHGNFGGAKSAIAGIAPELDDGVPSDSPAHSRLDV